MSELEEAYALLRAEHTALLQRMEIRSMHSTARIEAERDELRRWKEGVRTLAYEAFCEPDDDGKALARLREWIDRSRV